MSQQANDLSADLSGLTIQHNLNKLVDKILTNDLLFDIIFDICDSPTTIIRVSATCRTAYAAVQSYFTRACDVNALLSRYFSNPLEFRALQRRTGALVSGSTALQLFLRERYPDSDLDVYVRKDVREEVARWVLAQGYTYKPFEFQDTDFDVAIAKQAQDRLAQPQPYAFLGISFIYTFVKKLGKRRDSKTAQVQIIVATKSPMHAILKFHTSAVMNVIAWDYAYALYPYATIECRMAVFLRDNLQFTEEAVRKYVARGFEIHFTLTDRSISAVFGDLRPRWIGDKRTWTLRLSTAGLTPTEPGEGLSRDPCVSLRGGSGGPRIRRCKRLS